MRTHKAKFVLALLACCVTSALTDRSLDSLASAPNHIDADLTGKEADQSDQFNSSTATATAAATTTTTTTTTTTKKPKVISDCPTECECIDRRVSCIETGLKSIPNLRTSNFNEFVFQKNRDLTSVNFNYFPSTSTEKIDLSNNSIAFIERPKKNTELSRLRYLDLSYNLIDSINNLTLWRMPQLLELDISHNNVKSINQQIQFRSLINLPMSYLPLSFINETAFDLLTELDRLNLTGSLKKIQHLPDRIFSQNRKLDTLDLSYNDLIDVPVALRNSNQLKNLYLDGNAMTSLRPADFYNQAALIKLVISYCPMLTRVDDHTFSKMQRLNILIMSNNKKLSYISPKAFAYPQDGSSQSTGIESPVTNRAIELVDFSGNNLSTIADPKQFISSSLHQILLNDNPWNCDCNLFWLNSISNSFRSPMHCKTPAIYKDIEVSQFVQTIECDPQELSYQRIVLVSFLIFLMGLTVAVFVQKFDLCRRLQMRDQYGTIYYTKASFPTETV